VLNENVIDFSIDVEIPNRNENSSNGQRSNGQRKTSRNRKEILSGETLNISSDKWNCVDRRSTKAKQN
jgi:hypothetical protein